MLVSNVNAKSPVMHTEAASGRDADVDPTAYRGPTLPPCLDALACGGVESAALAAIMASALQEKSLAREDRRLEEKAQKQAEGQQIQEMRNSADAQETAGLISAGTQVVGALVGGFGGDDGKIAEKLIGAEGSGFSTCFSADAKRDDTEAKRYEQLAGHAKEQRSDDTDWMHDAQQVFDDAVKVHRAVLDAKNDEARATMLKG